MYRVWLFLVGLRLAWVMYPQQGYIHPDEFFQTVEVVAGDVYQVQHARTWEFRERIRSIVAPYLIAGVPMFTHRTMMGVFPSLQSAYVVLILPRILMFLASLAVDGAVYFVANDFDLDRKMALILCSTSYVTMVYNVRTFTNSLETFFFSVLIILVLTLKKIHDIKSELIGLYELLDQIDAKKENNSDREQTETNKCIKSTNKSQQASSMLNEHEEPFKTSSSSENHLSMSSSRRCNRISAPEVLLTTCIGVICVSGFFSRPTFLAYACIPLAAWSCSFENLPNTQKTKLGSVLFVALSTTALLYICVDTIYFNWEPFKECLGNNLGHAYCIYLQLYFELMVSISPYNFVEYNSLHGIHPRYHHLLVNVPLLYGPAVIFLLHSAIYMCKYLYAQDTAQWLSGDRTHQREHFCVMFVTFLVVPVCMLSFFPHQEPRFLIPCLPLVIVITVHYLSKISSLKKYVFFVIWISFNLCLLIFYGVFHQGGVVPSLIFIQQNLQHSASQHDLLTNQNVPYNLTPNDKFIYFHTYMPPNHLLLSNSPDDIILDLKGSSVSKLEEEVVTMLATKHGFSQERNVYVLCPGTLIKNFNFKFRYIKSFPYHLTLEDLPLDPFHSGKFWSALANLNHQLSLHLIQVNNEES